MKERPLANALIIYLIPLFLIISVLFLSVPSPMIMMGDADWALQLSGAAQIDRGEYPFVDFPSTYGPFVYGATYLGQTLSGHRLAGELLLIITGYTIGYLLIFQMAKTISRSFIIALLVLALGLLLLPRMYKYYIVLWPAASLFASWFYVDKPSNRSIILGSLIIAVAGLYRADFGVYGTVAFVLVIAIEPSLAYRQRLRNIVLLLALIGFFASPFLVWFISKGALGHYLHDSTLRTASFTEGLSKPFVSRRLELYVLFAEIILAMMVLVSFSNTLSPSAKSKFRVSALWGQLLLFQAFHRSDIPHFEQGFTLILVSIAALSGVVVRRLREKQTLLRFAYCIAWFGVVVMFFDAGIQQSKSLRWSRPWHYVDKYFLTIDDFINTISNNSDNGEMRAINLIYHCTQPSDAIATGPNLINMYFMTQRGFRGDMWAAYPEFLTSDDEYDTLDAYKNYGRPSVFVYQPNFKYDGRADRDPSVYLPILYPYFQENYVVVATFSSINVAVPRDEAENHPCNQQQFDKPKPIVWSPQ